MAKTYNTFTNVSTGDVLTATNFNNVLTNVNNYRKPPILRVRRAADQSIAGNVSGAVRFDTKDIDIDDDWGFTPSSNLLTVGTTGAYLLTATVAWTANATGARGVGIFTGATVSGATDAATITAGTRVTGNLVSPSSNITQTVCTCSTIVSLTAGDKIAVLAYQNSGGALSIQVAGVEQTTFSAAWLGQVS
jgi:hypothetical protein